jgi:hypothetical protein
MRHRLLVVVLLLTAVAVSVPAFAQTFQPRQTRPEWGIFASGVSNTGQKLVLTASFGGGYEDDLTKPAAAPVASADPAEPTASPFYSGPFGSLGANLKYSVDKKSVQGDVQFGAFGRNYRQMTDPLIGTYSASGNLSFAFGESATLSTNYYAGQYLQNLAPFGYNSGSGWGTPGVPNAPGDPGVVTTGDTYRGLGASANYHQKVTTNLAITAAYAFYGNDSWSSVASNGRYDSQYVNAGVRYSLAKGLGLRAGYGTTVAGFGPADQTNYRSRNIDVGVDYNKSLSLTRKSRLSFSTGLSGIVDPANQTHYYFVGNATFTHEIGRSWSFFAGVSRNTDFYQTLGRPTVTDWANVGLGGLIGRRVNVQGFVSWYSGSAVATGAKVYDSTNATASVQVALNRILAIGADYSYYRYGFADNVLVVPPGFVRQTDRQAIRVSLNVWAPLVTKARRANASR